MSAASRFVEFKIQQRKVMMFAKRRDPACDLARRTLEQYSMTRDVYEVCEIDRRHDCNLIENHFLVICLVSQRCVCFLKSLAYTNDMISATARRIVTHNSRAVERLFFLIALIVRLVIFTGGSRLPN